MQDRLDERSRIAGTNSDASAAGADLIRRRTGRLRRGEDRQPGHEVGGELAGDRGLIEPRPLIDQQDVGRGQRFKELVLRERINELEGNDSSGPLLEDRPLVAVADQDEPDRQVPFLRDPRSVDHVLQSLLGTHVAGVDHHGLLRCPSVPGAQRRPVALSRRRHVRPVADHRDPVRRDPQRVGHIQAETIVDHHDPVERTKDPTLDHPHHPADQGAGLALGFTDTGAVQVLHPQDGARAMAHQTDPESRNGAAEERRAEHQHHVGRGIQPPRVFDPEEDLVPQTSDESGTGRNVRGHTLHPDATGDLAGSPLVAGQCHPAGIVRRGNHRADVVPRCREPLRQGRGVWSVSRGFGRVVGGNQLDLQLSVPISRLPWAGGRLSRS
ncbi:hypothetical protein SDC9_59630 [bioreactor metagenome]|uniref:Uncharacterized protein n=1 Tax=bioreactor metagenome TaxID=1076179 RepID=A0A644XGP1_9ZZZZ